MSVSRFRLSHLRVLCVPAHFASFASQVLPLALLALLLTALYYGFAYRTTVLADDRIRGLFVGFQSIEGGAEPYRWSKGDGSFCLPAIGPSRPLAGIELRLLGSSVTSSLPGGPIDAATLQVGGMSMPLRIAPESRAYRMLIPPSPESGPVCIHLISAVVEPEANGRVAGVGLRSATLWPIGRSLPPPGQLLVNLWLCVGGLWLLRSVSVPATAALAASAGLALALGAALIGGALRVAPDLPFWSAFAAYTIAAMLTARLAYRWGEPRLGVAGRELLGVSLIGILLATGWAALANLEGFLWPFPLMARAGTAFSWGALPAIGLFAAFTATLLWWLRGAGEPVRPPSPHRFTPPPALAIPLAWLAAVLLPVALKAGLRGWGSLFQTFAAQEGNYIEDLPLLRADPLGFVRSYVALMPDLALHNKTHPPGATLFLYAVERLFGPGPEPAAWAVIAIAGLGVWPTYRLVEALIDRRAALLAAAIYALLPAYMLYAATSMDALYATVQACAIAAIYRAFVIHDRPEAPAARQIWAAVGAGCWIALGLLLNFTTLMLAFLVLGLLVRRVALIMPSGIIAAQDNAWQTATSLSAHAARWLAAGAALAGTVLLLLGLVWAATGYDSITAFFSGVANNRVDVRERVSPLGLSSYLFFLAVNSVAYGLVLGPWLLYRLGVSVRQQIGRARDQVDRPADALGVGMAALLLGMLFAGLFYREIERIWLFSHLLLAGTLADGIMQLADRRRRLLLAGLILVSLMAHSVIFRATLRIAW